MISNSRPLAALPRAVLAVAFFHQAVELSLGGHLPIPIVIRPVLEQRVKFAAFLPGERVDLSFDFLNFGHPRKL